MAVQLNNPTGKAGFSTDSFTYLDSVYVNIDSWNYIKSFGAQHVIPKAYVSEAAYRGGAQPLVIREITEPFLDEVGPADAGIARAYCVLKERLRSAFGDEVDITDI